MNRAVTKVSLALPKPASENESVRIAIEEGIQMAVAKLKRPKEDQFEELAERIAAEINERAAKMTAEERTKADAGTKRIATHVERRTR
jgi:hypothetical protein